jgi:hypothetical protein
VLSPVVAVRDEQSSEVFQLIRHIARQDHLRRSDDLETRKCPDVNLFCQQHLTLRSRSSATLVRYAVDDQVIEYIAFVLSLKLKPLDPGIGEAARHAARQHLQEIVGSKFALNICAGTTAFDGTGPFLFRTCVFLRGRDHRNGRLQIDAAVDLRDSVKIQQFRLLSKLYFLVSQKKQPWSFELLPVRDASIRFAEAQETV